MAVMSPDNEPLAQSPQSPQKAQPSREQRPSDPNQDSQTGAPGPELQAAQLADALEGIELREAVDKAKEDGDEQLVTELQKEEYQNGLESFAQAKTMGVDPLAGMSPKARYASPDVIEPLVTQHIGVQRELGQSILDGHVELNESLEGWDAFMKVYEQKNKAFDPGPWATKAQQYAAQGQMERTPMPEEFQQKALSAIGDANARLAKATGLTVADFPKYKHMVDSLSMGKEGAGYFDIEDPVPEGGPGALGRLSLSFGRAIMTPVGDITNGLTQLGIGVMGGFHSDFYKAYAELGQPTQFFKTANGNIVHDGGKVDGFAGPYIAMQLMAGANVDQIQKEMRALDETYEWTMAQASGAELWAHGIASMVGGLAGWTATGGAALAQAGTKGAAFLLGAKTAKLGKLGRFMLSAGGQGLGLGVWDAVGRGNVEGYGHAFLEGMKMGPVFAVVGGMGKRAERFLSTRKSMPSFARRSLEGATEGLALSAFELTNLTSSMWEFMKDPNGQTWETWAQTIVSNTVGMGLYKGLTGRTPAQEGSLETALGREGFEAYTARESRLWEMKQARQAEEGVPRETGKTYGRAIKEQLIEETGAAEPREMREERQMRERERRIESEKARKALEGEQPGKELLKQGGETFKAGKAKMQEEGIWREKPPEKKGVRRDISEAEWTPEMRERMAERKGIGKELEGKTPQEKLAWGKEQFKKGIAITGRKPMRDFTWLERLRKDIESMPAGREKWDLLVDLKELEQSAVGRPRAEEFRLEEEAVGEKGQLPELRMTEEAIGESRPGRPKSLDIQPAKQLEAVEGAIPTRPVEFILRAQGFKGDLVRVPIQKGKRFSSKGVLAWYRSSEHMIRTKGVRNVVTAAHEWSHAMENEMTRRGLLSKDRPDWMQAELEKAAETYPGLEKLSRRDRAAEGWAEFWARYILDDPRLPTDVPQLHKWAADWITRSENAKLQEQVNDLRKIAWNFIHQGAPSRVRQSWYEEGAPLSEVEKRARGSVWKNFQVAATEKLFDDVVRLKLAQAEGFEIAGIKEADVPITLNPPKLIDTFRMTARRQAEQFAATGTHDMLGRRTGEGLEDVFRSLTDKGIDWRKGVDYVVAKRSIDFINKGMPTTLGKADYLETVRQLESPEMIEFAQRIRDWATRVLDLSVEMGGHTEAERDAMVENNPFYLTFERALRDAPERMRAGRGVAERGTGTKKAFGAEEELRDPIQAMKDSAAAIITKAQQAKVMKAMYLQTKLLPRMGGFVSEVPKDVNPREVLISEIGKQLTKLGKEKGKEAEVEGLADFLEELAGGDPAAALTFFFQSTMPRGSEPIIAYRPKFTEAELDGMGVSQRMKNQLLAESGQIKWLRVNADAYKVLMGIDAPPLFMDSMPGFLKAAILGPARMVRYGATVFNVNFLVRNMLRDPMTRQMFTQAGNNKAWVFSGFGALIKGAADRARGTEGAQIFKALGLEGSTMFGTEIVHEMQGKEFPTLKAAVKRMAEILGEPEVWLRQREFDLIKEQKLKEGASLEDATFEAALAAKEVSVNFTRAGTLGRQINQLIPYFSPGMAGARKFWRSVTGAEGKGQQAQAITRGLLNLGGMSALVWAMHGDEDWYQELPLWRRVNYWTFKVPFTDEIMSIPKPFEAGVFFGTGVENLLQAMREYDPELAEETLLTFIDQHVVGFPWLPAPVAPLIEGMANRSFFMGRPIVPGWMDRARLPKDQYTRYTTETFKWIGELLNISPAKLEYVFSQYGGGLPRSIIKSVEGVLGVREAGKADLSDVPGLGTLFTQKAKKQSRSVQGLYDLRKLIDRASGSGELTPAMEEIRTEVSRAIRDIQEIRRDTEDSEAADRESVRIARPLMERWRRMQ